MAAETVDLGDFTTARKRIIFTIDGDEFEAFPALTVDAMQTLTGLETAMKGGEDVNAARDAIATAVETLLQPESAKLFLQRMADPNHLIDFTQFQKIFTALAGVHAGRPTESSRSSTGGSRGAKSGTTSTDGRSRKAATPRASRSRNSAT